MTPDQLDDPDLPLQDMMERWPETIPVFIRHRMLCVGCLVGPFHTLTDACAEYGLDLDAFSRELARAVTPSPLKSAQADADRRR
jgi:hybrid cluster-associated redox disulfide protein